MLQTLLGLVNNYQIYISNRHNVMVLFNGLLNKNEKWRWTNKCQKAFDMLKHILALNLTLTHFDSELDIKLASSANDYGVGAVFLDKYDDESKKAIAHVSRSLVPNERIEKGGFCNNISREKIL